MSDVAAGLLALAGENYRTADGPFAVELLRRIVAAHAFFIDRNDNGSHDEFQRAANAFYETIDVAEAWLTTRGLTAQASEPIAIPIPKKGGE